MMRDGPRGCVAPSRGCCWPSLSRAAGTLGGGAQTLSPALSCGSGCAARSLADTARGARRPQGLHWARSMLHAQQGTGTRTRGTPGVGPGGRPMGICSRPAGACGPLWRLESQSLDAEGGGRPTVPAWAPSLAPSSRWVSLGVSPPRPVGAPSREARRSGRPGSGLRLQVWDTGRHPTLFQGSLRAGSPSAPTCEDGIPAQVG